MSTIPVLKSENPPPHLLSPSPINNEKTTPISATTGSGPATIVNTNALSEGIGAYLGSLPEYKSTPRMQSLYSDLSRQKASNPSGYSANLGWWRGVLVEIVRRGLQPGDGSSNALTLKADQELSDALRVERVGRPAGLGTVIDDLAREGVLHRLDLFLSSTVSIYESGSVVGRVADLLIKRSFWWALGQLNIINAEGNENEAQKWRRIKGQWVVIRCVEGIADSIIAAQDEKSSLTLSDSLYTVESFKKYAKLCAAQLGTGIKSLSDTDVKVLIRYLARDRRVIIVQGEVIKFAEDDAAREVTTVDHGVLELKTTIEKVEVQVAQLESSIATRTTQIKAALVASRQEIAKIQLKSRNALQALLTQRLGTLTTLTAALNSIDQAHGDGAILKAYEGSARVLKEIMGKPEMQEERVVELMDDLKEQMENAEGVRRAVEEGGWEVIEAAGQGVDDDEVSKELAALVEEQKREKEEERLLDVTRRLEGQRLEGRVVTPKEEKVAELA